MKNAAAQIDAYIARAAPFARPILQRVRRAFHKGCPEIVETIKWGVPHFEKNGLVGGMAAFKAHATFGFWKGDRLDDPARLFTRESRASMCAAKMTDDSQLPSESVLADYVRRAVALNAPGAPRPAAKPRSPKPPPKTPPDLAAALRKNAKARATLEAFPPSHKREYVEWIEEAKRPETRARRVATTVEWLAKGKSRNWKYT